MRRALWGIIGTAALAVATGCSSSVGDSCTTDQDCGGRTCKLDDDQTQHACSGACFPGGYCTENCSVGDHNTCPTGSSCVDYQGSPLCLRICADDTECRTGYVCTSHGNGGSFCLSAG